MSADDARLVRLETLVDQQQIMLARIVSAAESVALSNERWVRHMEDSKRLWSVVEAIQDQSSAQQQALAGLRAAQKSVQRVGWFAVTLLSGGLAYLVKFWADRHGA